MKVKNTFHVSMVKPYKKVTFAGQEAIIEDVVANSGREVTRTDGGKETVEWKFEKILDHGKADNGRWMYLVKWVGHEPTWQPARDLEGCDDDIWEYHDEFGGQPPSWVSRTARNNKLQRRRENRG
ncbi:hypothetical protein V8F06_011507 [Rhypophila decipiens]